MFNWKYFFLNQNETFCYLLKFLISLDRSLVLEQESVTFLNDMNQILRLKFTAKSINDLKNPEGMNIILYVMVLREYLGQKVHS